MREMSELHAEIHTIQNLLPVYAKRYHGQHIAGLLVIFWGRKSCPQCIPGPPESLPCHDHPKSEPERQK